MRAWLLSFLDRLSAGLVPLDGDVGRREPAVEENDPCPEVQRTPRTRRPRVDEVAWIPRTILFGPPL
ncbi:MAG TPA: hypothetical protein VFG78_13625 [Gemmatimonadota bacterium]|nr:hypothetical protein [Gemmatimonadota bacterium]